MRLLVAFSIIFTLYVAVVGGASYFVNYETGVPGTGDGSLANPFALISESFSVLADGDELIISGHHENGTDCDLVFAATDLHLNALHLNADENATEASITCGYGAWHTLNLFAESISFESVFINTTGGDNFSFVNCNFTFRPPPATAYNPAVPIVFRNDKLERGNYLFDGCVFSLYSVEDSWNFNGISLYQAGPVVLVGFVNATVIRSLVIGVEGPNRGLDFRNGALVKVDQCEFTHIRHFEKESRLFATLAFMNNTRVEITNSHFHDIEGSAIRFWESRDSFLVHQCLFEDIRSNISGGAIDSVRVYNDLYYRFEVSENTFRSIHSRDVGGAVRLYMIGITRDNYFLDCSSDSDGGSLVTGGLIYRNIFENSYSGRDGGALMGEGLSVSGHFPTPNITGNLFYNTTAFRRGGGITVFQSWSTIEHNHFIKSKADQGGAVHSRVLYEGSSFQQNSFSQCEANQGIAVFYEYFHNVFLRNSVLCPETPEEIDRYIHPASVSLNNNFNCRYYDPNMCKGNPPAGATLCIGGRWQYDAKTFQLDNVPIVENAAMLPGNVTISNGAELVISEKLPTISVTGCLDLLGDLVVAIDSGELTPGNHSIVLFETTLGECLHVLTNTSGPDNSPFRVYERTQSCERVSGARASVSASRLSVLFTVNPCEGEDDGGKKKKTDSVLPIAVGVSVGVVALVAIAVVVTLVMLHRAGKLNLLRVKRNTAGDEAL